MVDELSLVSASAELFVPVSDYLAHGSQLGHGRKKCLLVCGRQCLLAWLKRGMVMRVR